MREKFNKPPVMARSHAKQKCKCLTDYSHLVLNVLLMAVTKVNDDQSIFGPKSKIELFDMPTMVGGSCTYCTMPLLGQPS